MDTQIYITRKSRTHGIVCQQSLQMVLSVGPDRRFSRKAVLTGDLLQPFPDCGQTEGLKSVQCALHDSDVAEQWIQSPTYFPF